MNNRIPRQGESIRFNNGNRFEVMGVFANNRGVYIVVDLAPDYYEILKCPVVDHPQTGKFTVTNMVIEVSNLIFDGDCWAFDDDK